MKRLNTVFELLAALAVLIVPVPGMAKPPGTSDLPETIAGGGATTQIAGWKIQSSSKVQVGGQAVSQPGFSTHGWYPVGAQATVFAGWLENGKYAHVLEGTRLREVNGGHFGVPWWYRVDFGLPASDAGTHTFVRTDGIIPCADLWLNGVEIADHALIAGAFAVHEIDVTRTVHPGINTLAVRVYPADPERDLVSSWIDWNPAAPDNNMGLWRGIDVVRSGAVSLHDPQVISELSLPRLDHARLTIRVAVRNEDSTGHEATVSGLVADVRLERRVYLKPRQTRMVTFDSATTPALDLDHPKVWWPAGMGAHPLYTLTLAAQVDGAVSDHAQTTFGIRQVSSHLTKQGYRQFVVNGMPILIRGAGWAPDMFLRDQPERLADEFAYVRDLGLNAIRTEGKLERQDFYDLADRNGVMILAGWECCDKWEAWAKTGGEPWDAHDLQVAHSSMASEAKLLRNHPSVIAFLIGSDNAPPPDVANSYVSALKDAGWPDAIISAASDQSTAAAGPSGMKMSGPYAWVPPDYWYGDQAGAAFGFNSETGAGFDIPRLESLGKMLTPTALEALWKNPDFRQFHVGAAWSPLASMQRFDAALAHRYGKPRSLADYVEKAQLDDYAVTRAQFEAYDARMDAARPATGVIYWMLNNAWPSLHWHLVNHDLDPAGAYFGAKKANEPLHIQYSYDSQAIVAVNHSRLAATDLNVRIRVRDLDGKLRYDQRLANVDLPANHAVKLATIPPLANLSPVYFVELVLASAGDREVSRNVYWLSTHPDQLDWAHSTGYVTPVSSYADFTALANLQGANVQVRATTRSDGVDDVTRVVLTNAPQSGKAAFFQHLSLRRDKDGTPILPVTWSDNDVTLWPGESATLVASYRAKTLGTAMPVVHLKAWNTAASIVPAPIEGAQP
ncbi:MAG TPA: glycoside hydrolase family 2 TIM barrel-domain containing protein [Rhodanobacter sp.]|nr:glycoside hydrolase family 2 TIM barrel-domain containing protein [Rhodanobacter sp.]